MGQLGHLGDGHHGAYFVIDHHDTHQDGVRAQGGLQLLGSDASHAVGLQIGHFIPLGFQFLHAVKHGMMLNGGGDDMLAPLTKALNGAENGPVIRFRAAGGEKYPIRLGAHCGSYLLPGHAKLFGSIDTEAVESAGIGPVLCHRQCHRLHRFLAGACGGGIVKIDHQ